MSQPKVSVIIPVYNRENFVGKCLDSVCSQTLQDIEIILVNDGSADRSYDICKQYQNLDNRIKIFNQENQGVSSARNRGIVEASGEWICFVDSDDIIERDYLENFGIIESSKIDLYVQGYKVNNIDGSIVEKIPDVTGQLTKVKAFDVLENSDIMNSPCFKLFRREIIGRQRIRFNRQLSLGEDHIFSITYFKYVNRVIVRDKTGYVYIRHPGSLTTKLVDPKYLLLYMRLYADSYFDIFPMSSTKKHESYSRRQCANLFNFCVHSSRQLSKFKSLVNERRQLNNLILEDGLNFRKKMFVKIYKLLSRFL